LDHTDLDMKEIQELIGDSYLREHFQEMGEKKVEVYLTQKLINIREKRHQKEKEQLQQEKKALSLELSKLREDKRELTKEVTTTKAQAGVEKHFGRYLAGGVIFLAIWILTYTLILLPTVQDSFIACVLAILISLIFGFLLGFKRYEWILQKFLDLVGTFKKS
jgi:Flp pilus assembly protein TadB